MQNFIFQNPVKVIFGKDTIPSISSEVPENAKVMITYGGGSAEKNGTLGKVRAALGSRRIVEFGGIEPNPAYETLIKAVDLGRKEQIDFILAVGGGSVIDGTKFISAAIPFAGEPWDIVEKSARIKSAIPFGTVLTLPATGSEMNNGAVISRRSTMDKLSFASSHVFPQFSILDPETTYSLPAKQVANGVVDAFAHVVEQYLTYPDAAPLQDRMAEGILLTLIEEGSKTLSNPRDYSSRANVMWCATMALNRLIGMGAPQDWSSHKIGHELTALYGLDHGQTLAIVIPANLSVRREAKREKLLQYAVRVWGIEPGNEERMIDLAIDRTREFFESLGVSTSINSYGITLDIEAVLSQLERHNNVAIGEKQDVTPSIVREILQRA